jgi:Cu(I)/Ag(I) efflux system membrane fusion protein
VQAVLPDVDTNTRTLTVRIGIDNALGKLSPGMFVSLDIRQPKGEPRLTVPSEAVIVTGQRTVVLLATAGGGFKPAQVVTGGQVGERTLILKGLEEGQSIVLSGQFLLDSEASLKSAVERLGDAQPSAQSTTAAQPPTLPPPTPPR